MCGRTCCALSPETYRKAASYYNVKEGRYEQPAWIEKSGLIFKPSTNICPTDVTPVFISGRYNKSLGCQRILQPMKWGLIPRWYKGDIKQQKLSTNNCRIEGLMISKLYSPCMKKSQRCVIICEGFYEWKTTDLSRHKQPYFIYSLQSKAYKVEDTLAWSHGDWNPNTGWNGPKLLYMAGLFDVWHSEEGEVYSYTVITMDSNETLSWCHHRMPAILSTDEQIEVWLDSERTPKEALEVLKPIKVLSWHPVSLDLNNARNKGADLNKPVQEMIPLRKSTFMDRWLNDSRDLQKNEPIFKKIKSELINSESTKFLPQVYSEENIKKEVELPDQCDRMKKSEEIKSEALDEIKSEALEEIKSEALEEIKSEALEVKKEVPDEEYDAYLN